MALQSLEIKNSLLILDSISKFIFQTPFILLSTPLAFFWMIVLTLLWITTIVLLHSQGTIVSDPVKPIVYDYDEVSHIQIAVETVIFAWIILFIQGSIEFIIACSCAQWYYTEEKSTIKSFQIYQQSFRWYIRQAGTVALGSTLHSILRFFQSFSKTICCGQSKEQKENNAQRVIFLNYCNKNAYIQSGIFGTSYCEGGKDSLQLLNKSSSDFVFVQGLGQTIEFIGDLFVFSVCLTVGVYLITDLSDFSDSIEYPAVLIAMFIGISLMIPSCFFKVLSIGADTMLQCYLMDFLENQEEKQLKEWTPQNLHDFMISANNKRVIEEDKLKRSKNRYQSVLREDKDSEEQPLLKE